MNKKSKKGKGWYNDKPQHRLAGRGIPTKADGERLDKMKSKIGGVYDSQIKGNTVKLISAIKRDDPDEVEEHLDHLESNIYKMNDEGEINDSEKDEALAFVEKIRNKKVELGDTDTTEEDTEYETFKKDMYRWIGEILVILGFLAFPGEIADIIIRLFGL